MAMINFEKLKELHPRQWVTMLVMVGFFAFFAGTQYTLKTRLTTPDGLKNQNTLVNVKGIGNHAPADVAQTVEFDQFWDLWKMIKDRFYKQPLSDSDLLYGAMQGLAAATGDPYTVFFEPKIAEEFQKSLEGKFEGIGAEIGIKEGQLQIVAPLEGTPAAIAGLLPNDAIIKIDDVETTDMTVEEAVSLIRGEGGTTVVLHIGRMSSESTATFDVSIVRDIIVVPSVRLEYPKEGIALITVSHFNSDTVTEFSKAVDSARSENVKGVIFDLRNNPGGFLDGAISIAGEWVGDEIVVVEQRQGELVDEFHGTGKARLKGIPTIVLVNEGSASASEIVAGALQDYKIATVVGVQTFGKGSVQDFTELEYGTAVKITVAEWLTPLHRSINSVGITPDVIIERTEQDYHDDRDPQLDKALELLAQ